MKALFGPHASRKGDVSDARRIQRIRARHDRRAGQSRPLAGTRRPVLVLLSDRIGKTRRHSSGRSMPSVTRITSSSSILPSLGRLSGESITVLGSQPNEEGVIVTSRINGIVPIEVDWQLNQTNNGYKVTNLFVGGINMATLQRSDLISVVQRNSGQVQALLVPMRDKNASNGIVR
jgi:hypothetical protein